MLNTFSISTLAIFPCFFYNTFSSRTNAFNCPMFCPLLPPFNPHPYFLFFTRSYCFLSPPPLSPSHHCFPVPSIWIVKADRIYFTQAWSLLAPSGTAERHFAILLIYHSCTHSLFHFNLPLDPNCDTHTPTHPYTHTHATYNYRSSNGQYFTALGLSAFNNSQHWTGPRIT